MKNIHKANSNVSIILVEKKNFAQSHLVWYFSGHECKLRQWARGKWYTIIWNRSKISFMTIRCYTCVYCVCKIHMDGIILLGNIVCPDQRFEEAATIFVWRQNRVVVFLWIKKYIQCFAIDHANNSQTIKKLVIFLQILQLSPNLMDKWRLVSSI